MKRIISATIAMAMVLCGLCSCGGDNKPKEETKAAVTQAAPSDKEIIEVSFNNVEWDDADFNKSVDRIAAYTETDLLAMASACAKGVAKAAGCTFEEAWDASYEIAKDMQDKAKELKEMLVLGHTTWSTDDKEKALILASDYMTHYKEINNYMEISGTTIESEILSIMNNNAVSTTVDESNIPDEETEETPIEINWDDEGLINNITAFAEYDGAKLNRVVEAYSKGYILETGYDEVDAKKVVKDIVKEAKSNATLVVQFLSFKQSWTDEVEETAASIARKFVAFAEEFQRYNKLVSEYEAENQPDETSEGDAGSENPEDTAETTADGEGTEDTTGADNIDNTTGEGTSDDDTTSDNN